MRSELLPCPPCQADSRLELDPELICDCCVRRPLDEEGEHLFFLRSESSVRERYLESKLRIDITAAMPHLRYGLLKLASRSIFHQITCRAGLDRRNQTLRIRMHAEH